MIKNRYYFLTKIVFLSYLGIGLVLSFWMNLSGPLTAFAWTGSMKGNLILLFWWFIVPALTWPYFFSK